MLSKLLLPVDFSDRVRGPARYARALAQRFHASITLLHVLPPPHYEFGAMEIGGPMLAELYATRTSHLRQQLDAFLAEELDDARLERLVLEGDPARKIVQHAHEDKFDLIVMPTHGYGRFRRFILGSITAKVLHDSDVPVFTGVHLEEGPAAEEVQVRQIVCALDLGAHSCDVLRWAARFRSECGARLTIVHATDALDPELLESFDPDWRTQYEIEAREEIERLQDRIEAEADVLVEPGGAVAVVCETARERKADLLVIGRSASEGVLGRLRAQAYSIIRQSPCPVISI
jgi:nucleotide-binding universal stress UspA family protein